MGYRVSAMSSLAGALVWTVLSLGLQADPQRASQVVPAPMRRLPRRLTPTRGLATVTSRPMSIDCPAKMFGLPSSGSTAAR